MKTVSFPALACAATFAGTIGYVDTSVASAEEPKVVGINVGGLNSLTTEWAFTDLIKSSERWRIQGGGLANTDALGNPLLGSGQQVETNVRLSLRGGAHYPTGTYTVTWEGGGELFMTSPTSGSQFFGSNNTSGGSGTITFTDPDDSIYLRIQNQNPSDPIRNIQVHMPGYGPGQTYAGQAFSNEFLETIEPFGIVRYMPWMNPNSSSVTSWSQVNQPETSQFANQAGVPVELMVQMANTTGQDPWFTIPVMADDEYVRQFATYVRDHLDPSLTAYVEYGNEVWNPQFIGRGYLEDRAQSTFGNDDLWYRQWAVEAKADFAVWSEVFAGQEDRMARVAAAQGGNRFHTPRFLDEMVDENGAPMFDVLSLAAYVGLGGGGYNASTTADDLLDALLEDIEEKSDPTLQTFFAGQPFQTTLPAGEWVWHRQMADEYGVPLIAYEAGQHIAPQTTDVPWYEAYVEAQRDERMYDVYMALLTTYLDEVGADGMLQFTSVGPINQYGAWGALEFQTQDLADAPKYRALRDYMAMTVPEPTSLAMLVPAAGALLWRRRR